MSAKIDIETARPLLPALRMMVRFPTRPAKVVSFETGVELSTLMTWLSAHGRPTTKALSEIEAECEGAIRGNRKGARLGAMTPRVASTPVVVSPAAREVGGLASSPPPREIGATTTAAPSVAPVVANPAAAAIVPAAQPKPPHALADLTGKERRHLVASVACGLLAGRSSNAIIAEVVEMAFVIVAEIVHQDAKHSAPNGEMKGTAS